MRQVIKYISEMAGVVQSSHDNTLRKGFQRLQENNKNMFEHSPTQPVRQRSGLAGPVMVAGSQHHHIQHQQQKHPSTSQAYHRPSNLFCVFKCFSSLG